MATDPIKRREQLREQHQGTTTAHDELKARVDQIAAEEDWLAGGGRPEPKATRGALEKARVAVARGESGAAADVKRLAEREAELERELSDAFDSMQILVRGKADVEADLRDLHVQHLDVFAQEAEQQVAEVLALGEQIAELSARYLTAWRAAQAVWHDLAVDNGLPPVGRCPLVGVPSVRGAAPRPEGVRPVDEPAVAEPEPPSDTVAYEHIDGRVVKVRAGTGHDDALRTDPGWVATS